MTDGFRQEVREALEINKRLNRLRRLGKSDPGYMISNRAELADAIGTDITMINKIIGPAREDSKPVKLVDRSAFVRRIREVLQLAAVKNIAVKVSRADEHKIIDEMSDKDFEVIKKYLHDSKGKK